MLPEKRRRRVERIKTCIRILRMAKKVTAFILIMGVLGMLAWAAYSFFPAAEAESAAAAEPEPGNVEPDDSAAEDTEPDFLATSQENYLKEPAAGEEEEPELPELPRIENQEPLTKQPVYPSDVYAESGMTAILQCYYPDADSYLWEVFDYKEEEWIPSGNMDTYTMTDELFRQVSCLNVNVPDAEQKARCTVTASGKKETWEAKVLPLTKEITEIAAAETDFPAGSYVSRLEYPLHVTYKDGTAEDLSGLSGLYFVAQEKDSRYSTSVSGNRIETVTYVNTEHEYAYADAGTEEIILRYRKNNDQYLETEAKFSGTDKTAPVIKSVNVSGYMVSSVDEAVAVTVSVAAEDDYSPASALQYAFLPEGRTPEEKDWHDRSVFSADIDRNGTWSAWCRDEGGNTAAEPQEVITVDTKAPVILSASLLDEEWCPETTIVVDAKDELALAYLFSCPETGEESGWIKENRYKISHNGEWQVQVKDAAGNAASTKIAVTNIDKEPPVINSIMVVEEGGENEEETE